MSDKIMRVIVIDDDPGVCQFLKKLIEKAGPITVIATTDPKAAEELCRREKPHLIILDNVMPGIQGAHLVKIFRHNAKTKKIPIIMLTGKGEMVYLLEKEKFEWRPNTPIVKERGELKEQTNNPSLQTAYGVDHYFSKPLNTKKFMETVIKVLGIQREKEDLDDWKQFN